MNNGLPAKTIVLDNGAYNVKAGFAGGNVLEIPNCLTKSKDGNRLFLGDELSNCNDFTTLQFRRAHEKGYLVNWSTETAVWDQVMRRLGITEPSMDGYSLILTQPPFTMPSIELNTIQLVFEEFGFDAYFACTPAELISWDHECFTKGDEASYKDAHGECILVIDSGYSFTHIIPVIDSQVQENAVRRIDVGGRFLTNFLKEVISYRKYNMMEETYLMNEIKESVCFVSQNFAQDLNLAQTKPKSKYDILYALPDYSSGKFGHVVKDLNKIIDQQVLKLANERFASPELLFSPSDVGLQEAGIPEAVMQSVQGFPEEIGALLLGNIVTIGGNCKFPGFHQRLEAELRSLSPEDIDLRVFQPSNPSTYAWNRGAHMPGKYWNANSISKSEYLEHGPNILYRRK
ncbi:actin-like protein Arp6 [Schizosaccharomyces osmophilus]|uniref:Actin-like protein ARP6 n=1 Tax=Schizosaccharomyces osmophilus TaxID=2545709 RepID=A0AAF0AZ28_9SCHI|nr:actin-like protein Arp6 [Schizosaccharomyces osmophilus]WBW75034.1 actin-like protein Arp6 [Schizosaccharomyces osmophilus]